MTEREDIDRVKGRVQEAGQKMRDEYEKAEAKVKSQPWYGRAWASYKADQYIYNMLGGILLAMLLVAAVASCSR